MNYRILRAALVASIWGLAGAALLQWALIRCFGDFCWPATILLFAPRWPLLLPLGVVTAACWLWQSKLLWLNLVTGLVLLGPVMGFCIPKSIVVPPDDGLKIRILTANIGNGAKISLLRSQLKVWRPDVIAFQETPTRLLDALYEPTWQWQSAHGLAVGSRFPILETDVLEGSIIGNNHDNGLRAHLRTPAGDVWICCVYLDSPRSGFESLDVTRRGIVGAEAIRQNTQQRSDLSELVKKWVHEVKGPTIIAGDMNQPPESYFQRRDWSSWHDTFTTAGIGYGHSWFSRWHGLRIDHVLVDEHWNIAACRVAGADGGDHRPVVAELILRK